MNIWRDLKNGAAANELRSALAPSAAVPRARNEL